MNGIEIQKKVLERYFNQGSSSLVQLILGFVVLSFYDFGTLGIWAIFQITLGFFGGVFSNTIIYKFSLNDFKLSYTDGLALLLYSIALVIAVTLFIGKISLIFLIIALLRNYEYNFSEFIIRRCYNRSRSVLWIGILRLSVALLLLYFLFNKAFHSLLLVCLLIYIISLITQYYLLFHWRVFLPTSNIHRSKVFYSFKAYLLYYVRGQVPLLTLSLFSLSALGGLSVARYFATPVVQLAPVITSLVMSSKNTKISTQNKRRLWILGTVFMFVSVLMGRSVLLYFELEPVPYIELLIFTLILLAILSNYRTYLESLILKHGDPIILFSASRKAVFFVVILSPVLVYLLGSTGSVLSLLFMEIFVTYILQRKNGNCLQAL